MKRKRSSDDAARDSDSAAKIQKSFGPAVVDVLHPVVVQVPQQTVLDGSSTPPQHLSPSMAEDDGLLQHASCETERKEKTLSSKHEVPLLVCSFPGCNKSFLKNYKLDRHMRSHTGEVRLEDFLPAMQFDQWIDPNMISIETVQLQGSWLFAVVFALGSFEAPFVGSHERAAICVFGAWLWQRIYKFPSLEATLGIARCSASICVHAQWLQ